MKKSIVLFWALFTLMACGKSHVDVMNDSGPAQFAKQKIEEILDSKGLRAKVQLKENPQLSEQAFRIRASNNRVIIEGGDAVGVMYGGLEFAERIELGETWHNVDIQKTPFQKNRGIKFNIPLDARCPSYDDTGDAAQKNIENMWDFSFWTAYFDKMAEYRYNMLSLWSPNPFQVMIKMPDYPNLALDDVCVTTSVPTGEVGEWSDAGGVNSTVLDHLKTVKQISIDEKIAFWQKVFAYAESRGVNIYLYTWNIYTNGTYGKYGLSDEIDNPKTKAYYRKAIHQFLETYPTLKGIGVTAGERMHVSPDKDMADERERWLWETYGLGILDYKKQHPDRSIHFVHRVWYSKFEQIMKYWKHYTDPFEVGYKYVKARIYSSPKRSPFIGGLTPSLIKNNLQCWWNLRNDDIYVYRWGDPDYVRTFLSNLPKNVTAGYHMGPDGYVFGRVFSDKDKSIQGTLEFDKHWYKFMLWGRLGYDNQLTNEHFKKVIAKRFPDTDATMVFNTWQTASKIIPQVNRFMFHSGDRHWAPEMCASRESFRYAPYFRIVNPMPQNNILNPKQYQERVAAGKISDKIISPQKISGNLSLWSEVVLENISSIQGTGTELNYLKADLQAFAWLGKYYSNKIMAAALMEEIAQGDKNKITALNLRMQQATQAWKNYAEISDKHYHPQMYARVNTLDWKAMIADVERDEQLVKELYSTQSLKVLKSKEDKNLHIDYTSGKSLSITSTANTLAKLSVFDDRNELVNYYAHLCKKGNNRLVWEDLTWLPRGKYTMVLNINGKTSIQKFER